MQFCVISPIRGLQRYSTLSKCHLILPQIKDEEYVRFYRERGESGDFLILDNGAYEGENQMKEVLKLIPTYKPDIVALPDYLLQDWKKTHEASKRFLDRHYSEFLGGRWMYIPQSTPGNVSAWIESCVRALDDPRITAIGIPRALATTISPDPLIRANACQWIKKARPDVYLHALGMAAGNVGELEFLADAGCQSIDSSAPVWRGWNGYDIIDTGGKSPVGDVDFQAKWQEGGEWQTKHQLIMKNLEACNVHHPMAIR